MKGRIVAGALSLTLTLSALAPLSGCGVNARAVDLTAEVRPNAVSADVDLAGGDAGAVAGFAVNLFQNSAVPGKNTLVSPLSVLYALAMTANGAGGETLSQMEEAFGLSASELNDYLHAYLESLPSGDRYKLSIADSIWLKDDDGLSVGKDFLQKNADYYGASIYKAAFDDATLKDINNWVNKHTDGMIDSILDEIPEQAVMYLINALAFDAEWETPYREDQVRAGTFTTEAGEARDVEMMDSTEGRYLDDGSATGFIKYYADRKYAFAALLPNEGVSVSDYIASLTGDGLMNTLGSAQDVAVKTSMPKFESEYTAEMSDALKAIGITDAFGADSADFAELGKSADGGLYISRVLHKTYIAVDEKGTKAGAATAVEVSVTSAPIDEPRTVFLDRPFVYLLIDCETNLPIFLGTAMDVGQ